MAKPKTKSVTEIHYGYAKKHYDFLTLKMPKGAKEQLKRKADEQGVTMSRYILEATEQRSGLKLTLDNGLPWIDATKK